MKQCFIWYKLYDINAAIKKNLQKPTIAGLDPSVLKQTVKETKAKSNQECVEKLGKTPVK